MSASFSLASADITITESNAEEGDKPETKVGVQITSRNGKARLADQKGREIVAKEGVVISARNSRNSWTVTFADGEVWQVARSTAGCSKCG